MARNSKDTVPVRKSVGLPRSSAIRNTVALGLCVPLNILLDVTSKLFNHVKSNIYLLLVLLLLTQHVVLYHRVHWHFLLYLYIVVYIRCLSVNRILKNFLNPVKKRNDIYSAEHVKQLS
jgi:hypothetical protein